MKSTKCNKVKVNNLSNPRTIKEIDFIIKSTEKEMSRPGWFYRRILSDIFKKLFSTISSGKLGRKEHFFAHVIMLIITHTSNSDIVPKKKEKYKPIYFS